ncbi:MAG: hypothetical protein ACLPWS_04340 [Rhodomicrobium sp.]
MSSKLRPLFGAFCFAFVISIGFLAIQSCNAAGIDDRSYLPPWMLNEGGTFKKVDENAVLPRTSQVEEVLPVKTSEPNSTDLTDKATQTRTKVVGFVSNLFKRSLRFATGE